jgi:hypothetical protein
MQLIIHSDGTHVRLLAIKSTEQEAFQYRDELKVQWELFKKNVEKREDILREVKRRVNYELAKVPKPEKKPYLDNADNSARYADLFRNGKLNEAGELMMVIRENSITNRRNANEYQKELFGHDDRLREIEPSVREAIINTLSEDEIHLVRNPPKEVLDPYRIHFHEVDPNNFTKPILLGEIEFDW